MPKAGFQEADAAAGGALFAARSLQFCGRCLPEREEEEEGKRWCWTTVPAIKNCTGQSPEWLLKPAAASSGELSCSTLGSVCWKSLLSPLRASLPCPLCLKAFMHSFILKCSLEFSEGSCAFCLNRGTTVRARQDVALPGELLLCRGFLGCG